MAKARTKIAGKKKADRFDYWINYKDGRCGVTRGKAPAKDKRERGFVKVTPQQLRAFMTPQQRQAFDEAGGAANA